MRPSIRAHRRPLFQTFLHSDSGYTFGKHTLEPGTRDVGTIWCRRLLLRSEIFFHFVYGMLVFALASRVQVVHVVLSVGHPSVPGIPS